MESPYWGTVELPPALTLAARTRARAQTIRKESETGWRRGLVELVGDDGVLDEELEGDDLQGGLVGGFEDDGAGGSGLLHLEPARGADTPAVAGLEAGKAILRHGGGEIVSKGLGGGEEGGVDDAADGVDALIFGSGEIGFVSAPITVTAVALRPRLFRRLPSRSKGAKSAVSKIGISTESKPIDFN